MRVMLVEDEDHKAEAIKRQLVGQGVSEEQLTTVRCVRDAVISVSNFDYDLIVLDMALPTFYKENKGGGVQQASGGVEVLRALKDEDKRCSILIITQYPDIIINGDQISLARLPAYIKTKYNQEVLGAVLYSYRAAEWDSAFVSALRRVMCVS